MANSAEWKPVPLVASVNQRYADTSVDGLLTNGYLEKDTVGTTWVRRRAGLTKNVALSQQGGNSGLAIMEPVGTSIGTLIIFDSFSAHRTTIWADGTLAYTFPGRNPTAWLNQSTVTTTTQIYASNGLNGAFKSGAGAFTTITDANYPPQTINGSAFLNGFLYVLDPAGAVWGTPNQNDFSVWSSTNVINAWGTIGSAVAIRKYLNEVIVFKTFSVEVFYDSGNAVGSPLLPVQQINIRWGCIVPQTIVSIDEEIFWLGVSDSGLNAVIRMSNFNPMPVSTPEINRLLPLVVAAFSCSMGGAKFYCLSCNQSVNGVTSTFILGLNIGTGEWSIFNTSTIPNGVFPQFPTYPLQSANNPTGDITEILYASGELYSLNDAVSVDSTSSTTPKAISMRLRTDNFTNGTSLRKMVSGLRVRADQKAASSLRLRWSDDDYQTWSAWRSIDLSKNVPMLPGLQGTFAKRAYEIEYAGSDPIRFSSLELLSALGDI